VDQDLDLSKGVLVKDGECAIDLYVPTLLRNALSELTPEQAEDVDKTASGLRFAETVLGILRRRHPRTKFEATVSPEDKTTNVTVVNHSNSDALMKEAMHLIAEYESDRRDKWLVYHGSLDQLVIDRRYDKQTLGEEDATPIPDDPRRRGRDVRMLRPI
jgi:hypothetical protein